MESVVSILLTLPGYYCGSHEAIKILVEILYAILKVEMLMNASLNVRKMWFNTGHAIHRCLGLRLSTLCCQYYDFLMCLNVYICTF